MVAIYCYQANPGELRQIVVQLDEALLPVGGTDGTLQVEPYVLLCVIW